MNNDSSRLRHTQKQESISEQEQQKEQKSEAKEFSSVEEILRGDSAQTAVPPAIAVKLNESISKLPKPAASWWQRIFPGK